MTILDRIIAQEEFKVIAEVGAETGTEITPHMDCYHDRNAYRVYRRGALVALFDRLSGKWFGLRTVNIANIPHGIPGITLLPPSRFRTVRLYGYRELVKQRITT